MGVYVCVQVCQVYIFSHTVKHYCHDVRASCTLSYSFTFNRLFQSNGLPLPCNIMQLICMTMSSLTSASCTLGVVPIPAVHILVKSHVERIGL